MVKKRESWFKRTFTSKSQQIKIDAIKDIKAIQEFIDEIEYNLKPLKENLNKLKELEKEHKVGSSDIKIINIETQTKIIDKLMDDYSYLQNDVIINGLRLKQIAQDTLNKASKAGLKDLVKEKANDEKWWRW